MQETLYLQRTLVNEIGRLKHAIDKSELDLHGWKARGPARIMLLAGWVFARTSAESVFIDLRDAELLPEDGEQLARLMGKTAKLGSIDVRGNESLGDRGADALVEFMATARVKMFSTVPRSIHGVTNSRSQLQVPKKLSAIDCRLLCAELESSAFAEGVSAGMGDGKAKGTSSLNRRGGSAKDGWMPLLWAAKVDNMIIAEMLLDRGHDVNQQEPVSDKGLSGYTPLHWAAFKGYKSMVELLLKRGADPTLLDKHSNTPKALAEKKGEAEVVAILDDACALISAVKRKGAASTGRESGSTSSQTRFERIELGRKATFKVPPVPLRTAPVGDAVGDAHLLQS